jgi:hypothetical protein
LAVAKWHPVESRTQMGECAPLLFGSRQVSDEAAERIFQTSELLPKDRVAKNLSASFADAPKPRKHKIHPLEPLKPPCKWRRKQEDCLLVAMF